MKVQGFIDQTVDILQERVSFSRFQFLSTQSMFSSLIISQILSEQCLTIFLFFLMLNVFEFFQYLDPVYNQCLVLSQRIFPSGNFPSVFSQVETSQMCNFFKRQLSKSFLAAALGPQPVLAAALGPLTHPTRSARPPLQPATPQRA